MTLAGGVAPPTESHLGVADINWAWRVGVGEYVYSYDMPDASGDHVLAVAGMTAWGTYHVASHALPMRLEAFVHGLRAQREPPLHERGGDTLREHEPSLLETPVGKDMGGI